MLKDLLPRLGFSCILLLTLPIAADEVVEYFQIPSIFASVAAIASCIGACIPVLSIFKNSD